MSFLTDYSKICYNQQEKYHVSLNSNNFFQFHFLIRLINPFRSIRCWLDSSSLNLKCLKLAAINPYVNCFCFSSLCFQDGNCHFDYKITEPGEYFVSIKFNAEHIPDSPFKVLNSCCVLIFRFLIVGVFYHVQWYYVSADSNKNTM